MANRRHYEKEKIANESVECRQQRLANQRQYEKEKLANKSVECRQKRLQTHQEYRRNISNSLTIVNEIQKFHAAVSRGPLYICSCCDQLWYKHTVVNAERLRVSNPNAGTYLLSKKNVSMTLSGFVRLVIKV